MKIRLRRTAQRPIRLSLTFHKRRKSTPDRELYMRPIRPVRMGSVNTEWATDGWYRQGVPLNNSLLLVLQCGHIELVPKHPPKLRKLVYCPMCFMLWTERMEIDAVSKANIRKRQQQRAQQQEELDDMAKKKSVKKSASSDDRRGRKVFEFVKVAKNVEDGTIMGIVHKAVQKVKSGTVAEITEAAIKGGLKDVTGQDPLVQTGVMLNRLKSMGSVKKVSPEKPEKTGGKKITLKLKRKK